MILEIVIGIAIGLPLIILSIVFLTGRGSILIAGYNTLPKNKKEEYDTTALCKFVGKITLPIGIFSLFIGVAGIHTWFIWIYLIVVLGLCVFAVIYLNTGNRFKK